MAVIAIIAVASLRLCVAASSNGRRDGRLQRGADPHNAARVRAADASPSLGPTRKTSMRPTLRDWAPAAGRHTWCERDPPRCDRRWLRVAGPARRHSPTSTGTGRRFDRDRRTKLSSVDRRAVESTDRAGCDGSTIGIRDRARRSTRGRRRHAVSLGSGDELDGLAHAGGSLGADFDARAFSVSIRRMQALGSTAVGTRGMSSRWTDDLGHEPSRR